MAEIYGRIADISNIGHLARIVPDNPIAFPPSVEVSGVTGLDCEGDSNLVRVGCSCRSPGKRGRRSVR